MAKLELPVNGKAPSLASAAGLRLGLLAILLPVPELTVAPMHDLYSKSRTASPLRSLSTGTLREKTSNNHPSLASPHGIKAFSAQPLPSHHIPWIPHSLPLAPPGFLIHLSAGGNHHGEAARPEV